MKHNQYWKKNTENPLQLAVRKFVKTSELTCKLSEKRQALYEEGLLAFIEAIEEPLVEEVKNMAFRKQVAQELEYLFDDSGKKLYEVLPRSIIDEVVSEWRTEITRRSDPHNFNGEMLRSILCSKKWCKELRMYSPENRQLYIIYLKKWYELNDMGCPLTIEGFFEEEMRDIENAPQYWNLLKEQDNPKRLTSEEKEKIEKIVDRAEELQLLFFDRKLAISIIEMATVHYDIDLDFMLTCNAFDFLHDFAQIPQHFDNKTGTFDNRFLPRASKKSLR